MCFIVAIIALALGYNFFMHGNNVAALGSFVVAIVFITFMIRNILYVRNLKKEKKDDS